MPLIHKFQAGYEAGVKAANPNVKVQVKYLTQPPDFSGFNDPAKGKTAAAGMYDDGADIIYAAAGGSGGGVFEAAKAAGTGHRRRLRPVQHRRPGGQGRHHDLDAQEGRRRGVRLHHSRSTDGNVHRPAPRSTT